MKKKLLFVFLLALSTYTQVILDPGQLYVICKVGDKLAPEAVKDGDVIECIDATEWTAPVVMSQHTINCFAIFPVERSTKSFFRRASNDSTRMRVKFKNLDNKFNKSIEAKLRAYDGDLIYGVDTTDFTLSSSDINHSYVYDYNAVSSGTYSVGSGGDYTTVTLAFADIANLTGNLTFRIISSIVETGQPEITEDLNNYTFTLTSNSYHYGNYNEGHILSINQGSGFIYLKCEGPGTAIIEKLNINRIFVANVVTVSQIYVQDVATLFNGHIRNNLLNVNSILATPGSGIRISDSTPVFYVYNNIVINNNNGLLFLNELGNANSVYTNNTCYNNGTGIGGNNTTGTFINNLLLSNTTGATGISNSIGYNNASSDATIVNGNWTTGSGNKTSINSNQILSYSINDKKRFLRPLPGSIISNHGKKPTLSNLDITNILWKGYPIGAKNAPSINKKGFEGKYFYWQGFEN